MSQNVRRLHGQTIRCPPDPFIHESIHPWKFVVSCPELGARSRAGTRPMRLPSVSCEIASRVVLGGFVPTLGRCRIGSSLFTSPIINVTFHIAQIIRAVRKVIMPIMCRTCQVDREGFVVLEVEATGCCCCSSSAVVVAIAVAAKGKDCDFTRKATAAFGGPRYLGRYTACIGLCGRRDCTVAVAAVGSHQFERLLWFGTSPGSFCFDNDHESFHPIYKLLFTWLLLCQLYLWSRMFLLLLVVLG
jgi:hypothetical protein